MLIPSARTHFEISVARADGRPGGVTFRSSDATFFPLTTPSRSALNFLYSLATLLAWAARVGVWSRTFSLAYVLRASDADSFIPSPRELYSDEKFSVPFRARFSANEAPLGRWSALAPRPAFGKSKVAVTRISPPCFVSWSHLSLMLLR